MWNDKATLFIDDTSLRLLVTSGQKIKKWADIRLEPGLVKESIVQEEREVGTILKNLFKSRKIRSSKVNLVISGLHSLTRPANLPLLPKSMLAEAVAREARRVLPVPMDQLYLSWRVIPGPKSRISIYMAATPRNSTDTIMRSLKYAGLEASRLSIKPLALTKAIPVNNAILVDLQPTEFDIAIMVGGISQPVRTISLPSEELNWGQKIRMIVSDLDRTIKFYNSNNPEKTLDSVIPIYVSGDFLIHPEYQKVLEEATGRITIAIEPVCRGMDQLEPGRFLANIAMAMANASPGREMTFPVANLNLLPVQYQPRPISLPKVVGIPGGVASACVVIPMVMMMQSTSSNINMMQNQLDTVNQIMNQKLVQKQQLKKEILSLDQKNSAVLRTSEVLNNSLNSINSLQDIINGDLLMSLSRLSSTIKLKSLRQTADKVEICGVAYSTDDIQKYAQTVLDYARSLDASERFTESLISSIRVITPSPGDSTEAPQSGNIQYIEFILTFTRG